jgi:hypothetical protein
MVFVIQYLRQTSARRAGIFAVEHAPDGLKAVRGEAAAMVAI